MTETTIGDIVGARKQTYEAELKKEGQKSRGQIIVRSEETSEDTSDLVFKVSAQNLGSKAFCCFGTNSPYLAVSKSFQNTEFLRVCHTEPAEGALSPSWNAVTISMNKVCNNDRHASIQFEVLNRTGDELESSYGHVVTKVHELVDEQLQKFTLKKEGGGLTQSVLRFDQIAVVERPSLMSYLQMGLEISFSVAVDFTASNGMKDEPSSLHYLDPPNLNQYEQVILAVGSIIEPYDTDRLFPAFGFGGKPSWIGGGSVQHCFSMNGSRDSPYVLGVQGILDTYRSSLNQTELYGPTKFSSVLRATIDHVKARAGQLAYNILLIITDGEIHDMKDTVDLIVHASGLPMSVIIIGVGNEKFKMMKKLDADKSALEDRNGNRAKRDCVQFVKFKKFRNRPINELAEKVLEEMPSQIVTYMTQNGIAPQRKQ